MEDLLKEAYRDDLYEVFDAEEEFLSCVRAHSLTQRSVETIAEESRLLTGEDLDVMTSVPEYLLEDTEKNTGLYIQTAEGEILPLRGWGKASAYSLLGIKDRAADAIEAAFGKDRLAEMVNTYYLPSSVTKKLKLLVEDEKVSGVAGGETYTEIPATYVIEEVNKHLHDRYSSTFVRGDFSHSFVSFAKRLNVEEKSGYTPELEVVTSDSGQCSVTFRISLCNGRVKIPLAPEAVKHSGRGRDEEIQKKLESTVALFDKGLEKIEKLKSINIKYPCNAFICAVKRRKINAEAAKKVYEAFQTMFEGCTTTAFEIFESLCECLMYLPEGAGTATRMRWQDDISKLLTDPWWEYDTDKPQKMPWKNS